MFDRLLIAGLTCLAMTGCSTSLFDVKTESTPNISPPMRTGEATIKNEWNDSIVPWVAERTDDGGYIVAGSAGSGASANAHGGAGPQAWAIKIDHSGRVLWTYYTGLMDMALVKPNLPTNYSRIIGEPAYHGAVSMPDGSAFLCGHMPHVPQSNQAWGLLTHLDAKGVLISEQLVSPRVKGPEGTKGHEGLLKCIRWGDGVAIIGVALRFVPPPSGAGRTFTAPFYWILTLDPSGKILWEKLIPAANVNAGFFEDNVVLQSHGADLVFSATDNVNSEVVHLSPRGEMVARKQLQGQYHLIRAVLPDGSIQVWGTGHSKPSEVLTLNDRMEEIGRKEGTPEGNSFPHSIYRMPDQSYVLFGSDYHRASVVLHTVVTHVDGNLRAMRVLEPLTGSEPFVDFGRVDAVAPGADGVSFVMAMNVIARGLDIHRPDKPGALPDFFRGVDVNFVQVATQRK